MIKNNKLPRDRHLKLKNRYQEIPNKYITQIVNLCKIYRKDNRDKFNSRTLFSGSTPFFMSEK